MCGGLGGGHPSNLQEPLAMLRFYEPTGSSLDFLWVFQGDSAEICSKVHVCWPREAALQQWAILWAPPFLQDLRKLSDSGYNNWILNMHSL